MGCENALFPSTGKSRATEIGAQKSPSNGARRDASISVADVFQTVREQESEHGSNDELTPWGWFSKLSDEDRERFFIWKNRDAEDGDVL